MIGREYLTFYTSTTLVCDIFSVSLHPFSHSTERSRVINMSWYEHKCANVVRACWQLLGHCMTHITTISVAGNERRGPFMLGDPGHESVRWGTRYNGTCCNYMCHCCIIY